MLTHKWPAPRNSQCCARRVSTIQTAAMYVEQSRLTVPAPLRGKIKRPDYRVGILGVGLVAFDGKAKIVYDGEILFDVDGVERLRAFSHLFI